MALGSILEIAFNAVADFVAEFFTKAIAHSPSLIHDIAKECNDTRRINEALERFEADPGGVEAREAVWSILRRARKGDPDRAREIEEHLLARGLPLPDDPR